MMILRSLCAALLSSSIINTNRIVFKHHSTNRSTRADLSSLLERTTPRLDGRTCARLFCWMLKYGKHDPNNAKVEQRRDWAHCAGQLVIFG